VNLFTRSHLENFKGIFYFFDLNNLKSLANIYKWLKLVYSNQISNLNYNFIWNTPILLIGTKKDLLASNKIKEIENKVMNEIRQMFRC
jgi:hypothetical protein